MTVTAAPTSTRSPKSHVFSSPVVQELPRPVEPVGYASTW